MRLAPKIAAGSNGREEFPVIFIKVLQGSILAVPPTSLPVHSDLLRIRLRSRQPVRGGARRLDECA